MSSLHGWAFQTRGRNTTFSIFQSLCGQLDNASCLLDIGDEQGQALALFFLSFGGDGRLAFVAPEKRQVWFERLSPLNTAQ